MISDDVGDWGAWRAGIGEMTALYLSGFDKPRQKMQQMLVIRTWYPGVSEPLDAVGWRP